MKSNSQNGRKQKEEKAMSNLKGRVWTGSIAAALIAAAALFCAMLQMEKNMLTQYEKAPVYVAACEIPKGELLTMENMDQYLTAVEMEKQLIPGTALQTREQVEELVTAVRLEKGALLTESMFEAVSEITKEMQEPVIASFKAEDLYQLVGGVLRRGDRIHIYRMNEEGEVDRVYENLFVQAVFDLSGNEIGNADSHSSVQRVNVYLDEKDVEHFYGSLHQNTLRVVKVCE